MQGCIGVQKCHGTDVKFAAILSASVLHLLISEQKEFGKANPSPHTSLAANSQSIKKVMPCHAIMSCHSNETRSQQNSYYCYIKYSISEVLDSIWCELICDMYWWRTWWKLHPKFSHSPGNHLQLEPRWMDEPLTIAVQGFQVQLLHDLRRCHGIRQVLLVGQHQ